MNKTFINLNLTMKKLFITTILFFTIIINSQSKVEQNIGDFNKLKVYNGIELELIKSDEQKVVISGDKSDVVNIKNIGKTLKFTLPFSLVPENNMADGEVKIKLFYNSDIDVIDANEGAIITGKDLKQNKLIVKSQERAFVNLVIETKYLEVKSSSGGIVKLSGTSKHQDVYVDLYGIYHGYNLKTKNSSNINAGTGAKAEISAGETLTAKVSFGGSIFYKGNPEVIKDKKVIGGIIQKRD